MTWLAFVVVTWAALALPLGLVLGRGMRIADQRNAAVPLRFPVPDFIPEHVFAAVAAEERQRG